MNEGRVVAPAPAFNLAAHRNAHPFDWMESFTVDGQLAVEAFGHPLPIMYRSALVAVYARVGTAPTGAAIIIDVNRDGITVFTTQSKRPQIAASAFESGLITDVDVTLFDRGSYCTIAVDQVGSTVVGSDLVVSTFWRFA